MSDTSMTVLYHTMYMTVLYIPVDHVNTNVTYFYFCQLV